MLCTGGGPLPGSGLRAASLWARPLPKKAEKNGVWVGMASPVLHPRQKGREEGGV